MCVWGGGAWNQVTVDGALVPTAIDICGQTCEINSESASGIALAAVPFLYEPCHHVIEKYAQVHWFSFLFSFFGPQSDVGYCIEDNTQRLLCYSLGILENNRTHRSF